MSDDKEIRDWIDGQFDKLEKRLTSGQEIDRAMLGELLLLMLNHLRILVKRNTVTEDECAKRMATCAGMCAVVDMRKRNEEAAAQAGKEGIGTLLLKDALKWVPTPVLFFVYLIGNGKGWW